MKNEVPEPNRHPLGLGWEKVAEALEALRRLAPHLKRRSGDATPTPKPEDAAEFDALARSAAAATEKLCRALTSAAAAADASGADPSPAETIAALARWSAVRTEDAETALQALPLEALLALQNLGGAAFIALLARVNVDPRLQGKLLDGPRKDPNPTYANEASNAGSDVVTKLLEECREDDRQFTDETAFLNFLRARIRGRRRDIAIAEGTRDKHEGQAAHRAPGADSATPSRGASELEMARKATIWEAETRNLPAEERAMVMLRHVHDWGYPEIAEVFRGNDIRVDLAKNDKDRERRRKGRESAAKGIKTKIENITERLIRELGDPLGDS